ncbi:MAG: aldehyde dehydrogenase family protein, partial [Pseudomonadota bacterium]|nr:aldehyde dehydrogenase family protein [Pseudomonadota bacterium]
MTKHDNLIGGKWLPSNTYSENRNPSNTDDVIGLYAQGGVDDVDAAVTAARKAAPGWAAATPQTRHDLLEAVGRKLAERAEEYGRLLSREEGKTLAEGIGETMRAAQVFKFFAGEALRV